MGDQGVEEEFTASMCMYANTRTNVTAECKYGPTGCDPNGKEGEDDNACLWYLNAFVTKKNTAPKGNVEGIDVSDFNSFEDFFDAGGKCREGEANENKNWK